MLHLVMREENAEHVYEIFERGPEHWRDLGRALATVHGVRGIHHGDASNGYWGGLFQDNTPHPDWPTLSQHLVADFAELSVTDVIREVRHAKEAVATAGMTASDGLLTGELIARHQLMLLAGRIDDMARLDPETHNRAAQMPSQSPPIDES